jgi:hypothetical protein
LCALGGDVTMEVAKEVEDQTIKMDAATNVGLRVAKLNHSLARYIPPRETWSPADEALYGPTDLYRVPIDEAAAMQLKAIKYAFTRHYEGNGFYHEYCKTRGVSPSDIKTNDDLLKIPLIPDLTFKQYPEGRDFARWLASVYTGEMPKVIVKGSHPTFDQVINAFNASGMAVTYSSGTSGRFTFIPRDQKTFLAAQYALAKTIINMWGGSISETDGYLLFPNPKKTNVFVGKVSSVYFDVINNVQIAIDRELTIELIQTATRGGHGLKGRVTSYIQKRMQQKMIDQIIQWLERHDKVGGKVSIAGAPYMLYLVINKLQADGKSFDFDEDSLVMSGGGWKVRENARIPLKDFRRQVYDVLGIPETSCLDAYGMVEENALMVQCPEGHYLHAPYTFYKPLVLNDNLTPGGYGEWGRLAFLDAVANSYPGFIMSGDRVRMLEHCPVCDRPGPVLEPEIYRAEGEEVRGCAGELQRLLAPDFAVEESWRK